MGRVRGRGRGREEVLCTESMRARDTALKTQAKRQPPMRSSSKYSRS